MRRILVLLLLISISFSSLLWKTEVGPVSTDPAVFNSRIIVGTSEGKVYALNPDTGAISWEKDVGSAVVQVDQFQGKLFVPASSGKVFIMRDFGVVESELAVGKGIAGAESGANYYVSAEGRIYKYSEGNFSVFYYSGLPLTAPVEYLNMLILGDGESLVALQGNGSRQWELKLSPFWKTKPVIFGNAIYIGGMDHNIYAVGATDGTLRWFKGTGGAITSPLYIEGGRAYAGSNDGFLYALDPSSGGTFWKGDAQDGIFTGPVSANIGGEGVVLVGTSKGNVFAFSKSTGENIWGYSTSGAVQAPLVYSNRIYLASQDGYVYSLSTDRACVITSPEYGSRIGYKEVDVGGRAFSTYGNLFVELRVNEGSWERAEVADGAFEYSFDPNQYGFGQVTVECRAVDTAGGEAIPVKIDLVRSENEPRLSFVLKYPPSVEKGETIVIYVNNSEGEPVKDFTYRMAGRSYKGSERIELETFAAGVVEVTVSKPGYEDKEITVAVNEDITLLLILGILVLAGAAAGAYYYVVKRKR